MPLVRGEVKSAAGGAGGVRVGHETVFDIALAFTARGRRIAVQGKRLACCHLEEVCVLFHDVAEPCRYAGAGRFLDGVVVERRVLVERQDGIAVSHACAKVELDLGEAGEAADLRAFALDVEDVVCRRFVAAVEFSRDGDGCIGHAVTDGDGVARRRARAVGKACVDVACDRAAVEVDLVARGSAAGCGVRQRSAVEVSCDGRALEVDGVARGVARFGTDVGTIAVGYGTAFEAQFVIFSVAGRLVVAMPVAFEVFGDAAIGCGGDSTAGDGKRVVFDFVADFCAPTPRFGVRPQGCVIGRMVVGKAVADDFDLFRRRRLIVGVEDVFVIAVPLGLPGTRCIIVRECDIVHTVGERQDMVRRGACRDGVEVLELHFRPVDRCVRPIRQSQQSIAVANVVRGIEIDVLKILDICGICLAAVDVQGVACRAAVTAPDRADARACGDGVRRRAEVDGIARRLTCLREAAVDVLERAACDVDGVVLGEAAAVRAATVDAAAHVAARDVDLAFRDASRRACVDDLTAVDVSRDRAARDVDSALCDASRRTCSRKRRTVDMADRAARNLGSVLRGASCLRTHLGAVDVGDGAARDVDGVLLGVAHRSRGFIVDDEAAVGCRRNRAARDGERVLLDLVANVRASRPCFIVRGNFIVRRRMVLELEARGRDLRRRCRMVRRVDRELEIAARRALDTTRRRIGVRRTLLEADAVRILHEDEIVCFVCLDRRVELLGVDVELPPVEVPCRTRIETQYGHTLRERMAVKVEVQMIKVLDVAGLRVRVDVQGVVCHIRLVAAEDRAHDVRACGEIVLAVAEFDGVARGRTCAIREAAVDISH